MEFKFLLVICVVVLLNLLLKASVGESCDSVVEERHGLVLYCRTFFTMGLKWVVEINNTRINVGECTYSYRSQALQCRLASSNLYDDYDIGIVPNASSQFTSYLTVYQVPRELTKVRCIPLLPVLTTGSTCAITVVVRPYKTLCNSSLTNSGQTFQVTCRFLVYPKGTCSLNSQFVLPDTDQLQLQTTYSHEQVNGKPLYQTTCTIEGIVHNVLYSPFRVEAHPDVENGDKYSTLSDWISLDNFDQTLVFTVNKLTTDISVKKQQQVNFLCYVNNIPDLTLTLYKGDLRQVIYRSPVVNTLQYTLYMTSCSDSDVYICRTDNDIIIEKRITVILNSCGTEDTSTTYTIVVYVALPLCLIILIVIVTISVVCIRRKIKLRNALLEAQARRTGDINMTAFPSRTSRGCSRGRGRSCHRGHRSRNPHVTNQPSYDVRYTANPPSYSSIFHTSSNNDVIPSADIPAFYPLSPPYETVYTQVEGEHQSAVPQCNQENNKPGDSIIDLPPPYPGS
ncbi:uncharacterized protein LOC131934855 [Physella acuta]|uniref:uncharacterized protein LOC131934855 n=1 Tax=Physella acuta TaxID=109671 RepID=UPI0027DC36ED|nr:uncharacterized protein LOC131934855 [Physella acuta]